LIPHTILWDGVFFFSTKKKVPLIKFLFIYVYNKINWELYIPINNYKFVGYNLRLSWEGKIKMLFLKKKKEVEYLFKFKIESQSFNWFQSIKLKFILSNWVLTHRQNLFLILWESI